MDGIQIKKKNELELISKREKFDDVDSVKIKVKKALMTSEDFHTLDGDSSIEYPIIPARACIGLVTETVSKTSEFTRGERVFPHPEVPCRKCFECVDDKEELCISFAVAGKNADGFLRDFAVSSVKDVTALPPSVSDHDALFVDHIALCVNVLDAIDLHKGEHVMIIGGDVLGIILAQLVIYYQGVPILIDNCDDNMIMAQNSGVYYTLFADNKLEKNALELTGTRLTDKIVYMTGSNLNTDIAMKLAGSNGTVCFAGFATPPIKVHLTQALAKNLQFKCVTTGFGSIDSAINLLALKAVDLSIFNIATAQQEEAVEKILAVSRTSKKSATAKMLIIEMN